MFARRNFVKDSYVCEHEGHFITRAHARSAHYHSDYVTDAGPHWAIDAITPESCYGRYMNDAIFPAKK